MLFDNILQRILASRAVILVLLVTASFSHAMEPDAEVTGNISKQSSLRVNVDPVTGKLVDPKESLPTADQHAATGTTSNGDALTADVDNNRAGPLQTMQDGSMMVQLNGQFNMPLRAKVANDGEVTISHDDDHAENHAHDNQ